MNQRLHDFDYIDNLCLESRNLDCIQQKLENCLKNVPNPIGDDRVEIPPSSHEEIKVASIKLQSLVNCLRPEVMSW